MEEEKQINSQDQHLNEGILCQNLSSSSYAIPQKSNSIKVKLYLMKHDFVSSMAEYSASLNIKYTNYITSLNALSEASGSTDLIDKFIKLQETLQSSVKNNLKLMSDFFDQANIKNPKPSELVYNIKKNIQEPNIKKEVEQFIQVKTELETKSVKIPEQSEKEEEDEKGKEKEKEQNKGKEKQKEKEKEKEIPIPAIVQLPVKPKEKEIVPQPIEKIDKPSVIEPKEVPIQEAIKQRKIIQNEEIEENINPSGEGELIKLQIKKPDEIQKKQSELNENARNVRKLKLSNLSIDNINTLFKIKHSLNEMTSFTIKKSSFDNPNIRKIMPNLEYLKLSGINTHFNSYASFISFPKLRELRLNSVNLGNKSFKAFMSSLLNQTNEKMASNLEVMSFKNNKINTVSLSFPKGKFENLRLLDFENNSLHTFTVDSFTSIPSIQYINLSSNNFLYNNTFEELMKRAKDDNSLVNIMIGGNAFLIKDNSRSKYIQYLTQTLGIKEMAYSLPTLTFNYLFNKNTKSTLIDSFVGYNIWNQLNELNLSFCQLKNEDLIKLFQQESNTFEALNKLNIASNDIDDNIFKLVNEKAGGKFKKLKVLDLSNTFIKGTSKNMVPFIKNYSRLKRMKIYSTPFEDSFCLFLRGLIETMKKLDPKEKHLNLKSDIEIAMNEFNTLFATFDQIGTITVKICIQVTSTTVCRKLQKTPPDCAKYFDIKE